MDLDRIKRNVGKMVEQNAPETDIDQYIASEGATLDQVRGHRTAMIDPRAAQPQQAAQPDLSVGETAADVGKSLGIGVAQGGIGLATLPGNVEQLGRLGINAASRGLGGNDIVSNDAFLPTYQDAKGAIEGYTGEFYKPKTTLGEYARTIGEFAPMAATGGGGLAARAANVLAPALVSETAGQVTKGTAMEPWARAAGGLAGGIVPRAVSPNPVDATRNALVQQLDNEGVTALTAGQRTGSKPLRWMESVTQDTPLSGGRAAERMATQKEQFTRAALRRAGENAPRATPDVIDGAFTRLGNEFGALAQRNVMRADRRLRDDLVNTVDEYRSLVPESLRAPVIENAIDDIRTAVRDNGGRQLPGDVYQAFRSRFERMRRQSINDPQMSRTLADLRDALDDAMERSISRPDAQAWRTARTQYRHLLTIEKAMGGAGELTAQGLLSPSQLRTAAKNQNKRAYSRGTDELANLGRAGEAIMKELPQSGTGPRTAAQSVMSGIGAAAGGAVGNVPGAVAGAFAPIALQGAFARALMSRPIQNYLSNQLAAGYMAGRPPVAVNALVAPQISQEYGLQGQTPYRPLFDENGNPLR
ncbi:conserved protein of unknown function [Hyphomicrobium sp. 1Nfss2.1]|uniref:hypothetical protein n=1 Tax=Hyphomicrobium sp. 1Nfss2.1 TaxID=3413936 RepID=UPI003C7B1A54